jgi:type I restriction enzyme S subunit
MSVLRYQKYKDSGVPWLSDVPEHWDIKRLKFFASLVSEKTDNRTFPVALENIEGWTGNYIETETDFQSDGVSFLKNDVLFGKLRPYLAKVWLAVQSGEAVGDFHVMRPKPNINPRLLQYHILNKDIISIIDSSTYGAKMPRASWEFVSNILLAFPTEAHEQKSIADFLDRETVKIDALVAEQERLIELLKEKRQAVISHAATKGLNPQAPMKPSGIDWLGDIPAHWDIAALKHIVATPITDGPHETPVFYDEGVPFVSAEAVSSGKIDFTKIRAHISHKDHERYSKKYYPKRNDIFMVKSGATTGVTAIVDTDREFNIWSPLAVIRCGDKALPKFVLHYMRSINFMEAVTLNWSFGTQQNIGMGVIENLRLALPPIKEQVDIAKKLDNEVVHYEELIAEAQKAIDLLQERRTAIISAAVTGKIDVRGIMSNQNQEAA